MNKENFVKTLLQSNAIKSENVDERVLGYIPLKGKWELRFAAYGDTLYLDKTTFIRPYIGNTISLIMSKKLMFYKVLYEPGPASTVEEHSLCNFSREQTVVRNTPWISLFRRDLFA